MNTILAIVWDVNPTFFSLFNHEIRWYGLLWVIGLYIATVIVHRIYKYESLPEKWFDHLLIYMIIGIILGARLGHCLFYDPEYYLNRPLEMLLPISMNSQGKYVLTGYAGLASHGGVIGIIIAVWIYSRKITKRSMLWVFDRLMVPTGITAGFIRLGNLMNSEIFGKPTTLPWGFKFVRSDEYLQMVPDMSLGCHPTQIYEALVYFSVFAICMFLYWKTDSKKKEGLITGIGITIIFVSRFLIEFIKNVQVDQELILRNNTGLILGQWLSIPFIIWGLYLIFRSYVKK